MIEAPKEKSGQVDSLAREPITTPVKTINFTHDIGHMLGLMHPYVDRSDIHGAWDIMWSFAFQRDFLGWNKWKLDWVTDDQVSCIGAGSPAQLMQLLSPIGAPSKDKNLKRLPSTLQLLGWQLGQFGNLTGL